MQIKKEEVINSILDSAENEFFNLGYDKASMRTIAKNADTTLGNVYNYFDSKEDLFSKIVDKPYNMMQSIFRNHNSYSKGDELLEIKDIDAWRKELRYNLHRFLPMFTKPFVILIEGSTGTKYSHARDALVDLLAEHFHEHLKEYNESYENVELAPIFAEELIDGVIKIVKNYDDINIQERLITEYVVFFAVGTMGILNN